MYLYYLFMWDHAIFNHITKHQVLFAQFYVSISISRYKIHVQLRRILFALIKTWCMQFIFCGVYACKESGVCYYVWNKKRPTHFCITECCTVIALISSNVFLAQTRISLHIVSCTYLITYSWYYCSKLFIPHLFIIIFFLENLFFIAKIINEISSTNTLLEITERKEFLKFHVYISANLLDITNKVKCERLLHHGYNTITNSRNNQNLWKNKNY